MKRVLIFSDSLALPREKPERTVLEDTYPYLLKKHFEVYQFSKGGGLVTDLQEQAHYYKNYSPDILILQCGIVDCAPRAYSLREEYLFKLFKPLSFIRNVISHTITTRKLRRYRRKTWTHINDYRTIITNIIKIFPNTACYALSILPANTEYESLVPGISENITRYNMILKEIFNNNLIDLSDITKMGGVMSDYHHLNEKGHMIAYQKIMQQINVNQSIKEK